VCGVARQASERQTSSSDKNHHDPDLTINLRIAITIAFLGVLLIATGALGILGMNESNAAQRDAYNVHFASVVALGKAGTAMSRARFGLDWAMSNPRSPQLNAQLERARMLLGDSDRWWNTFRDLPKTPELQRLTDDLDAKRTAVRRDGIDKLIEAIRTGDASWMDESRVNHLKRGNRELAGRSGAAIKRIDRGLQGCGLCGLCGVARNGGPSSVLTVGNGIVAGLWAILYGGLSI